MESITDSQGNTSFVVHNHQTYTFTASKKHYLGAPIDVIFTLENQNSLTDVKLFLSLKQVSNKFQKAEMSFLIEILISSPTLQANKDYELQVFACSNNEEDENVKNEYAVTSTGETNGEGAMIRTEDTEFGLSCLVYPNNEEDHWYRVVLKILNTGVLDGPRDIENIDPTFTSKLQSSNLYLQIFSNNSLSNSKHSHITTIYPPSYTENKEYWDVGYINPLHGKFIAVNAMSASSIQRKTHSRFMMTMFRHLNGLSRFNIKKEFGFNMINGTFKFNDFYLHESIFLDSLTDLEI
jgi:hypothetical protein